MFRPTPANSPTVSPTGSQGILGTDSGASGRGSPDQSHDDTDTEEDLISANEFDKEYVADHSSNHNSEADNEYE